MAVVDPSHLGWQKHSLPFYLFAIILIVLPLWRAGPGKHLLPSKAENSLLGGAEAGVFSVVAKNATLLTRRDDFDCGADKPCKNGACCGKSGYCGYGPEYCGNGCLSNCEAAAECGKFAKEAGKECPLNTCCSEFGFCGTSEEFCGKNCQSNCILHPEPPSGSTTTESILQKKVIGYYESWAARKDCHKVAPKDLPLDALTHVNYAFAYIDPKSLELTAMDGDTPESLFKDTADIKSLKPDLSVWISVGGWTFFDNDTVTQPLFGQIAGSESKRKTFADNAVKFMRQYGFEGMDIDWEYPGAPDRGGKPEDTKNFVELMKVLKDTFDGSGSKFGLTFTAPSSYWYLRWFDLPGLIMYADWINFMTYDLHGTWDATNPIGSIIQGHTNLTEIKLAAELFWRVKVPPEKLVMGFGFYGRAFQLADPACSKPGCAFKGPSKPGPCTQTGGILSYYELMDIVKPHGKTKRDGVEVVHDKDSAVQYAVYDKDQWISYDDKTTLGQKAEWASNVGLGGALVWASDLDDKQNSAHAALLGRSIQSTSSLMASTNQIAVVQNLASSNGQNCFAYTGDCVDLDNKGAMDKACGPHNTPIGWDDAGCGKKNHHFGKPICCPVDEAPKFCMWRGNEGGPGMPKSDCTAQCNHGEFNLNGIASSWGGGFTNDGTTNKCGRGRKAFCCSSSEFGHLTQGCAYTNCGDACPQGKKELFQTFGRCLLGIKKQRYCCPDPPQLKNCRWESGTGSKECVNAVCRPTELAIDRHPNGLDDACFWGRQKVACCSLDRKPPKPAFCTTNLCERIPGFCTPGDQGDGPPINGGGEGGEGDDDDDDTLSKRFRRSDEGNEKSSSLEKRYPKRSQYATNILDPTDVSGYLQVIGIAYPAIRALFRGRNANSVLHAYFEFIRGYCRGRGVNVHRLPNGASAPDTGYQTEHIIDRQIMARFLNAAVSGRLPSQTNQNLAPLQPIDAGLFRAFWHRPNTGLAARPRPGGNSGTALRTPNDRVMEAFGSTNFRKPLLAVAAEINGAKSRIMLRQDPTDRDTIPDLARTAVRDQNNQTARDALLQSIRVGFAAFEYMNTPEGRQAWNAAREAITQQLIFIEQDVGIGRIAQLWQLFSNDLFRAIEEDARLWAREVIQRARTVINDWINQNGATAATDTMLAQLDDFEQSVNQMRLPAPNPSFNTQLPK